MAPGPRSSVSAQGFTSSTPSPQSARRDPRDDTYSSPSSGPSPMSSPIKKRGATRKRGGISKGRCGKRKGRTRAAGKTCKKVKKNSRKGIPRPTRGRIFASSGLKPLTCTLPVIPDLPPELPRDTRRRRSESIASARSEQTVIEDTLVPVDADDEDIDPEPPTADGQLPDDEQSTSIGLYSDDERATSSGTDRSDDLLPSPNETISRDTGGGGGGVMDSIEEGYGPPDQVDQLKLREDGRMGGEVVPITVDEEQDGGYGQVGEARTSNSPHLSFQNLADLPHFDPRVLAFCREASPGEICQSAHARAAFGWYMYSLIHCARFLPSGREEWLQLLHPGVVELLGSDVSIAAMVTFRGKLAMLIDLKLLDINCQGLAATDFMMEFAHEVYQKYLEHHEILRRQRDGWEWVIKELSPHQKPEPEVLYDVFLVSRAHAGRYRILP